jgi:hypothetical protein
LHVGAVLRAKKSEVDYVKNWEALARSQLELKMKSHVVNRVDKFLSSHKNRLIGQDDNPKRKRQHIYFTSDDEEEATRPSKKILGEEIVTKMAMVKDIVEQLGIASRESIVTKDAVGTTSREESLTGPRSCPYPSAAEEKLRAKRQKQLQAELDIERRNAFQMSWPEVTDFVTTLKDACKNRTVPQVSYHLYFKQILVSTCVVKCFVPYLQLTGVSVFAGFGALIGRLLSSEQRQSEKKESFDIIQY